MLLGQQVLDMEYFGHYCYYGHFLSIMIMQSRRNLLLYANDERDYKKYHRIEMATFRGTTPSEHYQAFAENTGTSGFAAVSDISQVKNGSNKYFRHAY